MTSLFSHLNPIPAFPAYTGPYNVGTQDFEIPVSELSSPSPTPDPSITTISFRIFYPCEPAKHSKPVYWLPTPQSQSFRAYARFLNASHRLAAFLSYLPVLRAIFYTIIPAIRDAKLQAPPKEIGRWPVMVFSHGLGGSRNAYSHITGSIASHGTVVVAAEHRDGSAPISFIHDSDKSSPRAVAYRRAPHVGSPEVGQIRNEQLRIRLWELGLIHDALLKMDEGRHITNTAPDRPHGSTEEVRYKSLLHIRTPGKVSWAGHSFGAASIIQFVKSVFYPPPYNNPSAESLYTPSSSSPVTQQITPASTTTLLDLWALPLDTAPTSWLLKHPLPSYTSPTGSPPLLILSEAFYKWSSNLADTKRAISPPRPTDPSAETQPQPYIFYPVSSAHLSQSDFGPLFPWLTRKVFKAEDPHRTMRLNVRAILESLRRCGIKVADTSVEDMEINMLDESGVKDVESKQVVSLGQDFRILEKDGGVRGWISVPLDDGEMNSDATNGHVVEAGGPGEAVMEGEVMKD